MLLQGLFLQGKEVRSPEVPGSGDTGWGSFPMNQQPCANPGPHGNPGGGGQSRGEGHEGNNPAPQPCTGEQNWGSWKGASGREDSGTPGPQAVSHSPFQFPTAALGTAAIAQPSFYSPACQAGQSPGKEARFRPLLVGAPAILPASVSLSVKWALNLQGGRGEPGEGGASRVLETSQCGLTPVASFMESSGSLIRDLSPQDVDMWRQGPGRAPGMRDASGGRFLTPGPGVHAPSKYVLSILCGAHVGAGGPQRPTEA